MTRALAFSALLLLACATAAPPAQSSQTGSAQAPTAPAADLDLREMLITHGGKVELSPKVGELEGKRVRVRGWLVVFEEPIADGFWLAPQPVFQDESGAGSGDIPPLSIRVIAPPALLRALPADAAPLEVVGRLEEGRAAEEDGRPSFVRLVVEDQRDVSLLASKVR